MSASDFGFDPDMANPRTRWFREARFGLFIHWGLYALLGRGEWVMNRERIPVDEYQRLAGKFDASGYDPSAWADMARASGMRYAVLTSKHHEGFCLWDSKLCAYNAKNSKAKRDLFGEYVEAFRKKGLKVGVYYSLGDWYHPDWHEVSAATQRREPDSSITPTGLSASSSPTTEPSTYFGTICRNATRLPSGAVSISTSWHGRFSRTF